MADAAQSRKFTTRGPRRPRDQRRAGVNAPREKVYRGDDGSGLDPQWWGPRPDTTTVEEMDVRVGGRYRFVCDGPNGSQGSAAPIGNSSRLSASSRRSSGTACPATSRLTHSTFEDLGGEEPWSSSTSTFHFPEERDGMLGSGMEVGMGETYDRLEELLETL